MLMQVPVLYCWSDTLWRTGYRDGFKTAPYVLSYIVYFLTAGWDPLAQKLTGTKPKFLHIQLA